MGINIKELIKKESKYTAKANKLIKEKESLYSRLENASSIEEKSKIEENISKVDDRFSKVMNNLNETRVSIDKEMVSKVSKPRQDKTKFRSSKSKSKASGKIFKRKQRDYTEDPNNKTRYGKAYYQTGDDTKRDKVKTSAGVYTSRAREEYKIQGEEQTSILAEILKVLRGDSKEEKKDKKKKSKMSNIAKKMQPMMSAFSGMMDKAMLGMGALALAPQIDDFLSGTGKDTSKITKSGKDKSLLGRAMSSKHLNWLTPSGHQKFAEEHIKGKTFEKSPALSKITGAKVKGDEGMYISKKLAESRDWERSKDVIKKYGSTVTAGFDIKSKKSPHREDSSHYKGIKVDLRTRHITKGWGETVKEQGIVLKELTKFIYELSLRGATRIIYEYTDSTPTDMVEQIKKQIIPQLRKRGVDFIVRKTNGTGEHLDVMYDEKYALKKEDISQISKKATDEGLNDADGGQLFKTLGVDYQKLKKDITDRFDRVKGRLMRGDSIKESMFDYDINSTQPSNYNMSKEKSNALNLNIKKELEKEGYSFTKEGKIIKDNIVKDVPKLRKPDTIQDLKQEEEKLKEEKRSMEANLQGQKPNIVLSSNDNNSTTINNSNSENKFGYIYDADSELLLF